MTNRWFTDAAANGPAPITPEFTGFELGIFTAILAFAQDPANSDVELLHCLDAAGTTSFDKSTGRKAAPITPAMREPIGAGCVRQWHNHPSQDSLTHHGWRCAGASADLEILALNERGSIFVGRGPEWEDRLEGTVRVAAATRRRPRAAHGRTSEQPRARSRDDRRALQVHRA